MNEKLAVQIHCNIASVFATPLKNKILAMPVKNNKLINLWHILFFRYFFFFFLIFNVKQIFIYYVCIFSNLEIAEEISGVATQMENCFRLLIPHPSDNLFTDDDFTIKENPPSVDDNAENDNLSIGNKLRQHGLYDMKEAITIEITKSNLYLFWAVVFIVLLIK